MYQFLGETNAEIMILEVQICTFGKEGILRVALMELPVVKDVRYLISWQNPERLTVAIPEKLNRQDITIFEHNDIGLSNNRNVAINRSNADIILFSDDDLKYTDEGLSYVKSVFEKDDNLDFATFKHSGTDNKIYPDHEFIINKTLPRGYYVTSFELAVRRSSLPDDIRFSPMLGAGSPYFHVGEENLFMYRLTLNGLRGRFFPFTIVTHEGVTSGNRIPTDKILQGHGVWFWIRYGWVEGFLRVSKNALKQKVSLSKSMYYMLRGFFMARKYFDRQGNTLSNSSSTK